MRKAFFFDRDGVLIKDKHFLSDPELIEFEEGAKELVFKFKKSGWKVVIVTNQSGIHRNFFTWNDYEKVSEKLLELFGDPSPIDAIYGNGFGPLMPKRMSRYAHLLHLKNKSIFDLLIIKGFLLFGKYLNDQG